MLRVQQTFLIDEIAVFKEKLLLWSQNFETAVWLDSNLYKQQYSSFDCVLAVDELTSISTDFENAFDKLNEYQKSTQDYIFGYISYDVKNATEELTSKNYDGLGFVDLFFFQPKKLIFIKENTVTFQYLKMVDDTINSDFKEIQNSKTKNVTNISKEVHVKLRIQKEEYKSKVKKILEHIYRGDIYEANFCQEFFAVNANINPLQVYQKLNTISTPPFASFLKIREHYLLSASPERYLRKEGAKIISQPIKGTAKRFINPIDDEKIKFDLSRDIKERSENVMIVDLVRNDLSRTAKKGSVKVEELCKVYSFKQVHQMISTVVSEIKETTNPVEVIKDSFPMGSMTGAPKISAMQIIEKLETTKRGLYSGAVGYFTPNGDFDFNVVIRSILYNKENKYLSFSVGSAITAKSVPEKEYEECLLKAKAMQLALQT